MSFWATWLPFGSIRAPARARAEALASLSLEALEDPARAPTLIASGGQTAGALPVYGAGLDGAVYSSRGRGYASYNEDAAALFRDERGRLYAMALDQAGGLGGRIRGEASALAAHRLAAACRTYARGEHGADEFLEAFHDAHAALLERGEGEVTTAVLAVAEPERVHLVNSGDSGAVHFAADGRLRGRTLMQEFSAPHEGCLRHALGLEPEGCRPDRYSWNLAAGDWVILGSDGLLDSGLVEDGLGDLVARASDPEEVVNRVCTKILRRMGTLRSKPDNLTVIALRRRG